MPVLSLEAGVNLSGFYRQNRSLHSEHPPVKRAKLYSEALSSALFVYFHKLFPSLLTLLSPHGPHFFLLTTMRPYYQENTVINRCLSLYLTYVIELQQSAQMRNK